MHNSCSTNPIAGFLNQLFFQNKLMQHPHFVHDDTNSQLKVDQKSFGWSWSKMGLANLVCGF